MSLLTELEKFLEMFFYKDFAPDGAGQFHPAGQANVFFCDGHVESPTLKFLFADTSDAALARWKSLRTATNHLPHREKLSP
jgi:prepilin-type processing-associated H-X9-DG protein